MTMLLLLFLIGLGVWHSTRQQPATRVNWPWILAGGLLVLGFGGFGMMGHRGGMMGMGMHGGMMGHREGMMTPGGMMGHQDCMMTPGGGATGWQFWVGIGLHALLILGALVAAYFAWKRMRSAEPAEIQLLRMRLAKGEITADEFDLLRQKLQG